MSNDTSLEYKIAVMQEAARGCEIQAKGVGEDWAVVANPLWDWVVYQYRPAPPEYPEGYEYIGFKRVENGESWSHPSRGLEVWSCTVRSNDYHHAFRKKEDKWRPRTPKEDEWRPWTRKEVPVGAVTMHKYIKDDPLVIVGTELGGVLLGSAKEPYPPDTLFKNRVWKYTHEAEWKPCGAKV